MPSLTPLAARTCPAARPPLALPGRAGLHAFVARKRISKFYQSAVLRDALLSGSTGTLSWFLREQPQDASNWWYQMIGCGRPIAQLALQFQAQLDAAAQANATALMERAQWAAHTSTGANAADIAVVHIGNGLVNGNATYVAEAFARLWGTVVYSASQPPSSPEGPKTDGSYAVFASIQCCFCGHFVVLHSCEPGLNAMV